MLKPSDIDTKSDKCVFDVVREKHPPPGLLLRMVCIMLRSTFAC